ncbi:MAG: expansin EXLX1 family cellulose-binding protein [Cyanobacteria bacterium P01_G01_bin.67]
MEVLTQDLIRTNFVVQTDWDQGFTGIIELENTGDSLADWTIEFESQFEIYPDQIWGAEIVSREGDRYTLKPVDYNQTIGSQQSTDIYFNANKINGEIIQPQAIRLGSDDDVMKAVEQIEPDATEVTPVSEPEISEPELVSTAPITNAGDNSPPEESPATEANIEPSPENSQDTLSADVDFTLVSDWGSGFQGSISITNTTGGNIDSWNLEFDFPNQIDNIWDAEIEQNQAGSYVIGNAAWNREIAAGETITFGFTGSDSVTVEPQNFALEGSTFNSPSTSDSIYTYSNSALSPELELSREYQGRATFYDAGNPAGGKGNSGFDVPAQSELHKVVAINNIQWNGSEASGAFMEVSGPKQREGAAPIIVQVTDQLVERADGLDMSAEAFAKVANPVDGIVNIEYQLVGPADDYVTAYGYSIGQGIVVEGIADSNPWYPTLRLNNHRYPVESVELIEADGDLIGLERGSDNRFVLNETAAIYGAQDLLVTDIFGQQVTLDDVNISNGSSADTVTGEQFAMI